MILMIVAQCDRRHSSNNNNNNNKRSDIVIGSNPILFVDINTNQLVIG